MLATGSVALPIPGVEFGGRVVDTWGAWSLPELPKKIAVVGAGASGCEIASAYARFGTEVLLIEMLAQILPAEDKDMAGSSSAPSRSRTSTISTGAPVENVEAGEPVGQVHLRRRERRGRLPLRRRRPRAPTPRALGLEEAGVELEENGKIKVDEYQRTTNPKVYAIGDLVNKKALAHKASEEGVVAVETRGRRRDPPGRPEPDRRRHLQPPAGRQRRPDRGAAKEAGHEVKVGKLKLGGVGAGDRLRRQRRPGQARRRRQVRRDPRRPHRRQPRLRHDRRAGRDDGARGRLPGARADRPSAPDDLRGDPRRGPRRRRLGDPRLS